MNRGIVFRVYVLVRRWLPKPLFQWMASSQFTESIRERFLRPGGVLRLETVSIERELWQFSFTAPIKIAHQADTRGVENIICWIIARYCAEGMTCLDVGANYGYVSLVMAQQVAPQGGVHSFEPDPVIFETLRHNLLQNQYQDIGRPVQCAIADKDNQTIILGSFFGSRSYTAMTKTIDSYLEGEGLDTIDLIKIDVDGPELDVLTGAARVIQENQPVIITEVNQDEDKIIHFLESHSYECFDTFGKVILDLSSLVLPTNILACTLEQYQIIYGKLPSR